MLLKALSLLLGAVVAPSMSQSAAAMLRGRELVKLTCNDRTCRKDCSDCSPDSQECNACIYDPTPAPTLPAPPIKIACMIDSLTDEACCGEVYPPILQNYLDDATFPGKFAVTEYAFYACTMIENGNKPYKWDPADQTLTFRQEYLNAIASNPDYVIFMGGANDSKNINWITRGGQHTFQADTQSLYNDFVARGATVFAACPPAVGPSPCCGIRDDVIRDYQIPMIDARAPAVGAIQLDTYSLTAPHATPCDATDSDCWYTDDGVHFNEGGAQGLASFFKDAIVAQCQLDGLCCDCSQYTKGGACNNACGGGGCVWVGSAKRCDPI